MRQLLFSFALFASFLFPTVASAQTASPGCQFVLGFQVLHGLAADAVGDCINNQFTKTNGDAEQDTTKGSMFWRKADNWTAFTNGYMTWINGPSGLQSRLNTDRFPWEAAAPAAPPATAPAPAPASAPASAAPTGPLASLAGQWVLKNNGQPYRVDQSGNTVKISPVQPKYCTSAGQTSQGTGDPIDYVFAGVLSGTDLPGQWRTCDPSEPSWIQLGAMFTVSADGQHISGTPTSQVLTFDRSK